MSNRAGTDSHLQEAEVLEKKTGVKVLRHSIKKPGCSNDVLRHFAGSPEAAVSSPSEIAVIGDRLFTDIMLANMMGSLGVWVREGVHPQNGVVCQVDSSSRTSAKIDIAKPFREKASPSSRNIRHPSSSTHMMHSHRCSCAGD